MVRYSGQQLEPVKSYTDKVKCSHNSDYVLTFFPCNLRFLFQALHFMKFNYVYFTKLVVLLNLPPFEKIIAFLLPVERLTSISSTPKKA